MVNETARKVEWAVSRAPVAYEAAVAAMEARAAAIRESGAPELVWLLEHPALYSAGVSAKDADFANAALPVHRTGRGGQVTYHGPGQRVAYVMLDVRRRGGDVKRFVCDLENWVIGALAAFNVVGERRTGRVGVWVVRKGAGWTREDKIAALGVKIRRGVSFHGVSLNVEPDLAHYDGITPCGISPEQYGVTSLVDLGLPVTMDEADAALRDAFEKTFGATQNAAPPL